MTREEFQGHVTAVFSSASEWRGENYLFWNHGTEDYYEVSWITGGKCGGNCWGDSADEYVSSQPEPELDLLDDLLQEVAPGTTFLQYKKLLKEVVEHDARTDYEYYGNYTEYGIKRVKFDSLYESLVHMKMI